MTMFSNNSGNSFGAINSIGSMSAFSLPGLNSSAYSNLLSGTSGLTGMNLNLLTGLSSNTSGLAAGGDQVKLSNESNSLLGTTGTTAATGTTGTTSTSAASASDPTSFIVQMISKLSSSSNAMAAQAMASASSSASSGTTGTTDTSGATSVKGSTTSNAAVNSVANELAGYKYQFYYNDKKSNAETNSSKSGNCCDLAQVTMDKLKANGVECRMILGNYAGSSYNGGHYWVQYKDTDGSWKFFDPTAAAEYHSAAKGFSGLSGTYSSGKVSS